MKDKIKKICGTLFIIGVIAILIELAGWFLNPDWTDDAMNAVSAFKSVEDNSLDIIFYGSSHSFKSIRPVILKEEFDIEAYNYSNNWQRINTTDLFVRDSLESQTPKLIFVETYNANAVLEDTSMNGEIYYTRVIDNSEYKERYLKTCFSDNLERWASYYIPLIMFHSSWNDIDSENFSTGKSEEYFLSNRGYTASTAVVKAVLSDHTTFKQYKLSEDAKLWLDDIVDAAGQAGARVVFYTVPYEGKYGFFDAMKEYSVSKNCDYINLYEYLDEIGLDGNSDFRDTTHLNDEGAAKVTRFLGNYIKTHYSDILNH